jgi:hypothetical protein
MEMPVYWCSRVAIHFDVDVVDSNEIVLGLGAEPDGMTSNEVRRLVADVSAVAKVVSLTIVEFVPRQAGTFKRNPSSNALEWFSNTGTIIGNKVYSILYYSPEKTYPVYHPTYLHMIRSFELIPPYMCPLYV